MKQFLRILKLIRHYRFTVIGIILSSFLIASFWGLNLGAIYPLTVFVFEETSADKWLDHQVEKRQGQIAEIQAELQALQAQPQTDPADVAQRRKTLKHDLEKTQSKLATARWWKPVVHQYLPNSAFGTLIMLATLLVVGTALKCVCMVLNSVLVARLGQRVALRLRRQFFGKLLQLDARSYEQYRTGELIGRTASETNKMCKGVTNVVGALVREPLKMLACLVGAAVVSWQLLLLTLLVTPLAALATTRLARHIKGAERRSFKIRARLLDRLTDSFSGMQTVKSFAMEEYEERRFSGSCTELYRQSMRLARLEAVLSPTNELAAVLIVCLGILGGGFLVLNQQTHLLGIKMFNHPPTFPEMAVFFAFVIGLSDPLRKLSTSFGTMQNAFVASERFFEVVDARPGITDPPKPLPIPTQRCSVHFDDVCFHYQQGIPVLDCIQLNIPAGKTIAIVGPNGCGKSTLARLLLRLYDPTSGCIRFNGRNLREIKQHDLRRRIGIVTQQTWLFDDTILNNIRYGDPSASDQQVIEAAQRAHAHEFIQSKLDNGYQSNVGERGSRLSGGQRQRIALARVILRNPELLILDEATSQIDPQSETLIHQALHDLLKNRSGLIITHRMSALALADQIVVMDAGRITDLGTHDQLIERCELYRRLCRSVLKKSA